MATITSIHGADVSPPHGPTHARLRQLLEALHAQQHTEQIMQARIVSLQVELDGYRKRLQRLNGLAHQQQRQALTDVLTELPNRRAWELRLNEALACHRRHGGDLQLAFLDVDHFKRINDDFGHPAGDKALRLIARLLASRLRDSDFLARYGGEEFAILLPNTGREAGYAVLSELCKSIESAPFHVRGRRLRITCSAGLASFSAGESGVDTLRRADQALYRAKRNGRNRLELD
ncbi:GGDEF domain-containing protein [Ectopseudomonas khazarica]|uniref:GGDEF domain-containing protein n=1 Tax=Ectopseudomonas khazarica TaxID=2502979 RepID=UPI0017ACFD87